MMVPLREMFIRASNPTHISYSEPRLVLRDKSLGEADENPRRDNPQTLKEMLEEKT